MISFNKPPYVGEEIKYIEEAVKADFKAKNKKRTINSVSIYVKPEDMKAYYVIDGIIGDVALQDLIKNP